MRVTSACLPACLGLWRAGLEGGGLRVVTLPWVLFPPPQINQPKPSLRTLDPRILARGPDFTPAFADFGRQIPGGRAAAVSVSLWRCQGSPSPRAAAAQTQGSSAARRRPKSRRQGGGALCVLSGLPPLSLSSVTGFCFLFPGWLFLFLSSCNLPISFSALAVIG